jgi:hypothetical protein
VCSEGADYDTGVSAVCPVPNANRACFI